MSIYRRIKERGRATSDHYAGSPEYFTLTPASYTLLQTVLPLIETHCHGRILDAGAGRGVYRQFLQKKADIYVGMDISHRHGLSVLGDVQRLPFSDCSFDIVFCSQVLEHVPEPWQALAEFRRVLKEGGHLILTVPHISWLHNEPHDYYRYTPHGLAHLLIREGFRSHEIAPAGGIFSLAGHIGSTLWMNISFGIPIIHKVAKCVNLCWVESVAWLDRLVEKKKIFALNYVCLARK